MPAAAERFRLSRVETVLFIPFAAAVLVCTVGAFLGRFWWLADILSHFRMQYLVPAFGVGVWCLVRRRWRFATVLLILSGLNATVLAPRLWTFGSRPVAPGKPTLRLLLANVHRENEDFARVASYVRAMKPDVVVLEEVDARWQRVVASLADILPHVVEKPREDDFGIALLSRLPLETGRVVSFGTTGVPSIEAQVRFGHARLTIIATHPLPPNGAINSMLRNEHLSAIGERLRREPGAKIVIGDLNTTPWNHHFQRLAKTAGLADSGIGWGYGATWPDFPFYLRIPLDHCLVSADLAVLRRVVGEDLGSDHLPLVIDVALR